jgi:hypothetical protein
MISFLLKEKLRLNDSSSGRAKAAKQIYASFQSDGEGYMEIIRRAAVMAWTLRRPSTIVGYSKTGRSMSIY